MANRYLNVTEGSTAVLKCPTKPVYTWSDAQNNDIYTLNDRINHELNISNKMSLDDDRNLLINDFAKDNARTYRCSTDDKGIPVWYDFNIRLIFKPIFYKNDRNITLSSVVGNVTNISLDVNSYPTPTVSWGTGNGGTLGNWKVSTWSNDTSIHRLTSSVLLTARDQFGLYRGVIRNSEGSIDICIRLVEENIVDVQPKHVVCNTTQTVKLRCKIKNVESSFPTFIWNHYLNGVRIRRLNGDDHNNVSVLSITYCSYQDVGDYSCTVAYKGRNMTSTAYVIVQGAPVIIKQDVIADSSNVTLSVTYISEPPLMYLIWFINDENVNESNASDHSDVIIQSTKVDVPVNYYKTPIIRNVHQSKLSFSRAVVSHMDTISCHLKNFIGSREPLFEANMLTITINNKEISNIIYVGTTELESIRDDITVSSDFNGLDNEQAGVSMNKSIFIYVAVLCAGVLTTIIIVAAVVRKYVKQKLSVDLTPSNRTLANRQYESPEEDDASETLNQSQYAEIDDVSYHSVTRRDYSLDNVQEYIEMNGVVNNDPICLNTQCYEDIRDSLELHAIDCTNTNVTDIKQAAI
ncbi:unnamed protein product [Mytilus coruscus]|uniref:Ig-like domain-containing protein n=1 Tax=Mytilus coruscus TaxID=42192 RepID=A0A6J8CZ08_MYTCO|nr:unnamed protein product [Mytilus coruscus]